MIDTHAESTSTVRWSSYRSRVVVALASALASFAAMGVYVYLDPPRNHTWLNLAVGLLVLVAPLVPRQALERLSSHLRRPRHAERVM